MDFIVNNWLAFGGVWAFFLLLLVINFILAARAAWSFNTDGVKSRFTYHIVFGFLTFISFVPFAIGAIVHLIRYVNKQ